MSGLTAASEALLAEMREDSCSPPCLSWDVVQARSPRPATPRERLIAIEAAAIASVLTVDRVAAALHAWCESEWDRIGLVDPKILVTMHGPDAHHEEAARVVAALTGGQG